MSVDNPERKSVVQCTSDLTSLLKHHLSCSGKLLEKGLITEAVHDWILTAPAVSNQQKAARLVSCLADRVGGSSQLFHELVQALKEIDPFCGDIVHKLTSLRSSFSALRIANEEEKKQVGAIIDKLERQFSSLQKRLSSELTARSEVSPEILLESLTLLPVALRSEYQKFILENLSTLKKADSIREFFIYLNPHISFIDYHLVEYLVEEFASRRLKNDMSVYVAAIQVFYDETTVQQLMDHWPGRRDIPPHFEELRAVIDEDPGTFTLRRLDNLRKEFCSEIRLFETVLILKRFARKNSFVVCWVVPSIFVPQLKSVMSRLRSFYQREHIFSVTVGTQRLYSIAAEYEERLLFLCSSPGAGNMSEFQYLLNQPGLETNIYDKRGCTPLYYASYQGRNDLIQLLIEHGAEVDLPADEEWKDTPLMAACIYGHAATATLLIEKGAKVNYITKKGHHPLYTASHNGNLECVKVLLDRGAQIDLPTNDDPDGTALLAACQQGHINIARLLIERGAAIDDQNKDGASPLYMASQDGHDDVIQLLIERGASINLPSKDEDCFTALFPACGAGQVNAVKTLVSNGADVNYQSKGAELWTPLLLASYCNEIDVLKLLIQYGAQLDTKNKAGLTALMLATENDHASAVQTLLQDGKADPNITDKTSGWTAIFFAAKQGNTEIARQLIVHGARLDIKDKNDVGPLDIARVHGHQHVCDLIQQYSDTEREKEITMDQKEQVKKTSQHLTSIFAFLERTLLRGQAEKREKKKKVHQERESSNIQEAREQREVAVEAVQ